MRPRSVGDVAADASGCLPVILASVVINHAVDPYGRIPEFKFCVAKVEVV